MGNGDKNKIQNSQNKSNQPVNSGIALNNNNSVNSGINQNPQSNSNNQIDKVVWDNAVSLFESGRDFTTMPEISSPSALSNTRIPKNILLTGSTNDLVEYYIKNQANLSDIELNYLMDRYANIKYINHVKDNRGSNPKIEQRLEQKTDGTIILPDLTMTRGQDTNNGCWSCAYEMLLKSKGAFIDQKNIRGYRPNIKKEDVAEITDDSAIGFYQDRFYSIMESSDLALDVLPNTAMMGLNFNIEIDKQNYTMADADKTMAKTQLIGEVRNILLTKKTPVTINEGSHFYTIVGMDPQGNFLCKDSYGSKRKTDPNYTYTYDPNMFIDKALTSAPFKGVNSISIQLNYLEDLDVQNGELQNFKGTDLEKFYYENNELKFDQDMISQDFFENNSLNVNGQLFGTVKNIKEGFTISKTAYMPKNLVQMQPVVQKQAEEKIELKNNNEFTLFEDNSKKPEVKPEVQKPKETKDKINDIKPNIEISTSKEDNSFTLFDNNDSKNAETKPEEKKPEVKPEEKPTEKSTEQKTNSKTEAEISTNPVNKNIQSKVKTKSKISNTIQSKVFEPNYDVFKSLGEDLEKAKTLVNSSEYKNLTKLTKLIGQNVNIGGSEKLPAEQAFVYKMSMMKELVDAYLTHKGKDGVKSNVYGKLYVVEKLSKTIKSQMQNVQNINFEFNGKFYNPKSIKMGYKEYAGKFARENPQLTSQYRETKAEEYDTAFENAKLQYPKLPKEAKDVIIDVDHCMGKILMNSIVHGRNPEMINSLKAMKQSFLERPFQPIEKNMEDKAKERESIENRLTI